MKQKHATVRMAGFANPIPLIGIAPDATEETCERCGGTFHLSEVKLDEHGKPICQNCQKPEKRRKVRKKSRHVAPGRI